MNRPKAAAGPRRSLLTLGLLAATGCQNFHVVEPGRVYRTGQPYAAALEVMIQTHGIKTILRLRGGQPGQDHFDEVVQTAKAHQVTLDHQGMSATHWPSVERLRALWSFFEQAEYPVLVHCRGGADRTGLACALYILQRTGNLDAARQQLSFTYLHTGMLGTDKLDRVLDEYEPWQPHLSFPRWAQQIYGLQRSGQPGDPRPLPPNQAQSDSQ